MRSIKWGGLRRRLGKAVGGQMDDRYRLGGSVSGFGIVGRWPSWCGYCGLWGCRTRGGG